MRTTQLDTRFAPRSLSAASALILLLLAPGTLRAQTAYAWNVGNGNWGAAGSWTPGGGPPGAIDSATISTAGAYTATLADNRAITNLTLNNATATLDHTGGTLTLGGTLALTAGTYSLNGGTISGGSITSGGGRLTPQFSNANFLDNVAVGAGVIDYSAAGARLRLRGTTTLAAGTVLNLLGGQVGCYLGFEQTATVNNVTVNLLGDSPTLTVEGGNTLTLGPTTTVTCNSGSSGGVTSGIFIVSTGAVLINQGLIRNTGSGSLGISPSTFTNQAGGIVRAESGTITIHSATNLTNFAGTTLTGGAWEAWGIATLDFGTRSIATLGAGTTVVFDGANPTFASLNALTQNNGTLRVLGGKTFTPTAASVNNAGVIQVGTGSTFGKAIDIQTAGRLEGSGTVTGAVTVGGTIAPGTATLPIGTLTTGGQTWASGGVYEVSYGKIFGPYTAGTDNDYLTSPGGALTVTATSANKFHIHMNYTGSGEFADPPPNATIKIATFAGGVPATFDLSQFQLEGDIYHGGSVFQLTPIGNDVFLTFTPVPEPASVLAFAGLALAALGRRRRNRRPTAAVI